MTEVAVRREGHERERVGFFTDTTVCIGCKACEVACKQWNDLPADGAVTGRGSYDHTGELDGTTWRHVRFVEISAPLPDLPAVEALGDAGAGVRADEMVDLVEMATAPPEPGAFSWLFMSDVCKHCTHAGCLDACPTGALLRTEFDTVVLQPDVCNGCGYCVPACPFGVVDRVESDGRAAKCTLCYDRLQDGLQPACATACPTQSIQFGDLDELRERAQKRVTALQAAGVTDARLYGEREDDGVGGVGAFFLLLDEPEVYGLPPDPVVTTRDLPTMWRRAALAGVTMLVGAAAVFTGGRR